MIYLNYAWTNWKWPKTDNIWIAENQKTLHEMHKWYSVCSTISAHFGHVLSAWRLFFPLFCILHLKKAKKLNRMTRTDLWNLDVEKTGRLITVFFFSVLLTVESNCVTGTRYKMTAVQTVFGVCQDSLPATWVRRLPGPKARMHPWLAPPPPTCLQNYLIAVALLQLARHSSENPIINNILSMSF